MGEEEGRGGGGGGRGRGRGGGRGRERKRGREGRGGERKIILIKRYFLQKKNRFKIPLARAELDKEYDVESLPIFPHPFINGEYPLLSPTPPPPLSPSLLFPLLLALALALSLKSI
jgi:hypothetical protein